MNNQQIEAVSDLIHNHFDNPTNKAKTILDIAERALWVSVYDETPKPMQVVMSDKNQLVYHDGKQWYPLTDGFSLEMPIKAWASLPVYK